MTAPVGAIRDALTYLARFRGSLFVIKVDDRVLESPMAAVLVHDIVLMQRMGIHTVVVAGARAAIDRALERASLPSRYHRGLRVTTEPMMEHVIHAVSALSTRLMSLFSPSAGLMPPPATGCVRAPWAWSTASTTTVRAVSNGSMSR